MKKIFVAIFLISSSSSSLLVAQDPPGGDKILLRHYREGEKLRYRMKAVNEDWHYEIQADGVVKKDSAGSYFEEYQWSNMISDGQKAVLSPASLDFRQRLSLDPNVSPRQPNLSQIERKLHEPIFDFMTFYADLWLAVKLGNLNHAGDHFYFPLNMAPSWADGSYTLIGEDSIDFDFTLKEINQSDKIATLLIRHVPPEKSRVKLPADWMQIPFAGTANNWVQVQKTKEGKYSVSVGKETFDVVIKLSLTDGKILSATMDNPVVTIERECEDAMATKCGDPKPHLIRRQIEISLEP
jgi:hypothetical protein